MPSPIDNPPNPFLEAHLEWDGAPPPAELVVYEERATRALSENDSSDLHFRWSVNPYRGCFHGCAYCYARPTHHYLGFGAGTDFDRRIVVKTNIAERLRAAFERKSWRGERVVFSGNTDCYQPLEASYALTQRCLEVCREFHNPVSVVTKSKLIRRDVQLLAELAEVAQGTVAISCSFADDAMARRIEPFASSPTRRFETVRVLADAGVPVHVLVAPVIPGLNDDQLPAILTAAKEAGALSASMSLVRLVGEVREVFEGRLEALYPLRVDKVKSALRQVRASQKSPNAFGERMRGAGARWYAIEAMFRTTRRRLGLEPAEASQEPTSFLRPGEQLRLL